MITMFTGRTIEEYLYTHPLQSGSEFDTVSSSSSGLNSQFAIKYVKTAAAAGKTAVKRKVMLKANPKKVVSEDIFCGNYDIKSKPLPGNSIISITATTVPYGPRVVSSSSASIRRAYKFLKVKNLPQLNPNLSQLNLKLSQLNPNLSQLNPNLSQF